MTTHDTGNFADFAKPDDESFAEALIAFLKAEFKCRMLPHFSWRDNAEKTMKIYQQISDRKERLW